MMNNPKIIEKIKRQLENIAEESIGEVIRRLEEDEKDDEEEEYEILFDEDIFDLSIEDFEKEIKNLVYSHTPQELMQELRECGWGIDNNEKE